jgi:hypothetical protein
LRRYFIVACFTANTACGNKLTAIAMRVLAQQLLTTAITAAALAVAAATLLHQQKKQLKQHLVDSHGGAQYAPHACTHPGCTKAFVTATKLQKHALTHSRSYSCEQPQCAELSWGSRSELLDHVKEAHPPVCPTCDWVFHSASNLKKHVCPFAEGDAAAGTAC